MSNLLQTNFTDSARRNVNCWLEQLSEILTTTSDDDFLAGLEELLQASPTDHIVVSEELFVMKTSE